MPTPRKPRSAYPDRTAAERNARYRESRVTVNVQLVDPAAQAALALALDRGMTKTEAVGAALVEWARHHG